MQLSVIGVAEMLSRFVPIATCYLRYIRIYAVQVSENK